MASLTDKLTRVSDSNTGRPVIAQLASGKSVGATSITLNSATNWTTVTKIHFAIYSTTQVGGKTIKDTTSQTEWEGTLSGTTVSNLTLTGGVDQTYLSGAYVELTPTAKYAKDLYDGLAVLHNPDGTLKDGAIGATAKLADSIVTTAKIADGAVTIAKTAGNPYKFRAYVSANYNLGTSGDVVRFNAETQDTNSNFDTSTYRYTAPLTGTYQINSTFGAQITAGNAIAIALYKNGLIYAKGGQIIAATTFGHYMTITDTIALTSGDYIDIRGDGTNGSAIFAGSSFSGFLVSTT